MGTQLIKKTKAHLHHATPPAIRPNGMGGGRKLTENEIKDSNENATAQALVLCLAESSETGCQCAMFLLSASLSLLRAGSCALRPFRVSVSA